MAVAPTGGGPALIRVGRASLSREQAAQMAACARHPGCSTITAMPIPAPAHRLESARSRRADPVTMRRDSSVRAIATGRMCNIDGRGKSSPEIVAYTAAAARSVLSTAQRTRCVRKYRRMKTPPTLATQASTRYTALAIVLHGSRSSHRGGLPIGLQMSDARYRRAVALDQRPQVDWVTDPGPFGAEAIFFFFLFF